ncbi:conserved hypothetical protein [Beggiatoa sp. PS]|nr:conserved hypothetical protein [Beggiatoa sp. PS]
MAYGKFKSVAEVAEKFDITVADKTPFIEQKAIQILEVYFYDITEKLTDNINFINEITICEAIIRPILSLVLKNYEHLKIWSHVPYNIDEEKGLVGEPDYLIAPKTKYGAMAIPSLCIIEAKKDDFDEGWTQALAEMVASSLLKAPVCYGVVTTGKLWEFGKLDKGVFTVDTTSISATTELQRVFNTLNWVLSQSDALGR